MKFLDRCKLFLNDKIDAVLDWLVTALISYQERRVACSVRRKLSRCGLSVTDATDHEVLDGLLSSSSLTAHAINTSIQAVKAINKDWPDIIER